MKLTGNTRYRVDKRGWRKPLLVLQVEEAGRSYSYAGGYVDSCNVTQWRDATLEDLSVEFRKELTP